MEFVILNGEIMERENAKVDIEDRGYQFGDGVYEVIRIYNGKLFAGKEHLQRLGESAKKIGLELNQSINEIEQKLQILVEKNQVILGTVYLQFTRGVASRNHAFPPSSTASSFVAYTKNVGRPAETMKNGVKALLVEDIRWLCCDIKSLNLLGNLLSKQKAVEAGCYEAILHRDEIVTEGSASNITMIKNGVLYTHPANNYILNGITRQKVLEICSHNNIPAKEQPFTVQELLDADEVFLSSTTVEVTPIIEIDGKTINNGKPGELTVRIQELLDQEITRQCGLLT